MLITRVLHVMSCCCYHKGTYFQANHNKGKKAELSLFVVVATTKVRIFKQITTEKILEATEPQLLLLPQRYVFSSKSQHNDHTRVQFYSCCCYHKGTYFQANHNEEGRRSLAVGVVVATTKVRIFKQITTSVRSCIFPSLLLLLPQRYVFSSKSQHKNVPSFNSRVVVATTKVRIFKRITTGFLMLINLKKIFRF